MSPFDEDWLRNVQQQNIPNFNLMTSGKPTHPTSRLTPTDVMMGSFMTTQQHSSPITVMGRSSQSPLQSLGLVGSHAQTPYTLTHHSHTRHSPPTAALSRSASSTSTASMLQSLLMGQSSSSTDSLGLGLGLDPVPSSSGWTLTRGTSIRVPGAREGSMRVSWAGHPHLLGGLQLHLLLPRSGLLLRYRIALESRSLLASPINPTTSQSSLPSSDSTANCVGCVQRARGLLWGRPSDAAVPLTVGLAQDPATVGGSSVWLAIGRHIIGTVDLTRLLQQDAWTDSDSDSDEKHYDSTVLSVASVHSHSQYFLLRVKRGREENTYCIVLPDSLLQDRLLPTTSPADVAPSSGMVGGLGPLVRAVLAATDWEVDGLVGFLLAADCELLAPMAVCWAVAAMLGVPHGFVLHFHAASPSRHTSSLYLQLSAEAAANPNPSTALAEFVLMACHYLAEDESLRNNNAVCNASLLRECISETVRCVGGFVSSQRLAGAVEHMARVVGGYRGLYGAGETTSQPLFVARNWLNHLLENNADSNTPPQPVPQMLPACPSISLVARFFEYFSLPPLSPPMTASQRVVSAFIFALNEADLEQVQWELALTYLPTGLGLVVECALLQCVSEPLSSWPDAVLRRVGREDLCRSSALKYVGGTHSFGPMQNKLPSTASKEAADVVSDGLSEIEKISYFRFTEDDRLHEVCRMLRSSQSIYLKVEKAPEVSELDHRHKLQMRLLALCRRTLANSVGRGMLSLATCLEPLMAEVLPIPPLALTGRVPPAGSLVTLDTSSAHAELTLWPEYHNGVAAALRIGPAASPSSGWQVGGERSRTRVTRNWVIYNKTATQSKPGGEATHAGFLLGLGLQGHLTALSVTDICDYLTQGHEPTTISILIGAAASKIGSADPLMSRTLCLHLPALLPAQHWDIEISPLVQTSALIGLGLLHCGSGHRLMTEFLLAELSRTVPSVGTGTTGHHPAPGAGDGCDTREAVALAAAWALGMVLLGKGGTSSPDTDIGTAHHSSMQGLVDLRIEDRLETLMNGGRKPAESSLFPSSSGGAGGQQAGGVAADGSGACRSSRVLEGDVINTDVTSPGAAIALGLIYIGTRNPGILQRLALPRAVVTLDRIRPELLLYRSLARCLVLGACFEPTTQWLTEQIPRPVTDALSELLEFVHNSSTGAGVTDAKKKPPAISRLDQYFNSRQQSALSARSAFPLYLASVAGHCFGLGLVFAGTANRTARDTLLTQLRILASFRDAKSSQSRLGLPPLDRSVRAAVESALCTVAVSLGCVQAGSGDLESVRLLRELRWKVEDVSFGSHLALSMAIGLLFLAGGTFSLQRDSVSTASLLLALCPRFPSRTVDNQYHLQALRHLYVLATENRALHTIDVDSGLPVTLDVEVHLSDGSVRHIVAPGLLPELSTVTRIVMNTGSSVNGSRNMDYYCATMEFKHPQSVHENVVGTDSTHRKFFHRQVNVPPLLVKRIHAPKATQLARTTQKTNSSAVDNTLSIQEILHSMRHAVSQEAIDKDSFEYLLQKRQRLRIQKMLQEVDESSGRRGYLANPEFLCILSNALAD
eukprot:CAMPEP_0170103926 /NCGR_PEP_ID=MMETSP0020_2-20130122/3807_1 /TAXON_ID=98059 /ORGANISM="Dinobryon sp., Strain UTEXLB2267" /LENGTH=1561 /DNA_ID=CAMNT_0010327631 /DNA_START=662 /DNA_END=5347 /DNA_ORIENTATION=+